MVFVLMESKVFEGQVSMAALLQLFRLSIFRDVSSSDCLLPILSFFQILVLMFKFHVFIPSSVPNKDCYPSWPETDLEYEVKMLYSCDGRTGTLL